MTQIFIYGYVICLLGADNNCINIFVREYSLVLTVRNYQKTLLFSQTLIKTYNLGLS